MLDSTGKFKLIMNLKKKHILTSKTIFRSFIKAVFYINFRLTVKIILLSASLIFVLFLNSINPAFGENVSQADIDKLKSDIKTLQIWLESAEGKRTSLEEGLKNSELEISKLAKKIKISAVKAAGLQKKVKTLRTQETQLLKKRQKEAIYLSQQIKAAYSMGRQEYLKVLLNQQNPDRVSRLVKYYDYINKERTKNIDKYLQTAKQLAKVKRDILDKNKKVLATHNQLISQQKLLTQEQSKRRLLVEKLGKDIKGKGAELDKLKKDQIRLEALLAAVAKTITQIPPPTDSMPFAHMRGKLKMPVKGKVITNFGGSLFAGKLRSHGIFLAVKEGESVKAIHGGRVVFSEWMRGFGMTIILDHGEDYMSVYAHNQSLFNNLGDWVKGGQTIAQAGSSGGLEEPSLYFEIRKSGQPINPLRWIAKR